MNGSLLGFGIRVVAIIPSIIFTASYRVEGHQLKDVRYTKYDRDKSAVTMIYYKITLHALVTMNDTIALLKGDFAHV